MTGVAERPRLDPATGTSPSVLDLGRCLACEIGRAPECSSGVVGLGKDGANNGDPSELFVAPVVPAIV